MRYSKWDQRQLDIESGLRMDAAARSNPQDRRLTPEHVRHGLWECKACESCNDEENDVCWNCEEGRDV